MKRLGASTLIQNEVASVTLFPSKIPWFKPPSKSRVRQGSGSHKRVALEWLRTLWGLFGFLEGVLLVNRPGHNMLLKEPHEGVNWTAVHEDCAFAMFKKLVKYVSHPVAMERGTATLDPLIAKISLSPYDPAISFENGLNGALDR